MAAKAVLLLQLSLLLVSSFTVSANVADIVSFASAPHYHNKYPEAPEMAPSHPPSHHHHHHHHHGHPPSHAPMYPPKKAPVSPPKPAPVYPPKKAPVYPPKPAPVYPPKKAPVSPPKPAPVYPPKKAPVPPPKHAPVYPPTHAPAHPPVKPPTPYHFPRSFVAVQGVVYCKSCKYAGATTLLGATPILGAVVKLQCNNTRYPLVVQGKTDKNGYFFIEAPKTITNFGAHKCKVSLVSSPLAACGKPSTLHGGLTGATLRPEKRYVSKKLPFALFTVGPLAFEPKCY